MLDTATHATRGLGPGDLPQWSHNGKRIACVFSGNQIWTTNTAGGQRVHVITTKGHISALEWSPGDDRIAFSDGVGTSSSSGTVAAAGGRVVALGEGAFPQWSPDATALTVESRDGYLYLLRADGSARHRLTKGFGAA